MPATYLLVVKKQKQKQNLHMVMVDDIIITIL